MVRIFYFFIFLFLFSCFPKTHNKKDFVLTSDISINEIKTDGYYYNIYELKGLYTKYTGKSIRMKTLLKNGYIYTVKNGFGDLCSDSIGIECAIEKSEYMLDKDLTVIKDFSNEKLSTYSIWNWGKYEIKGDSILIQWFYNNKGDYYLVEEKGIVIDSSNFVLKYIKDYRTGKEKIINEEYKFKKYDIKNIYNKTPKYFFNKLK
jgi:hypothetical protein